MPNLDIRKLKKAIPYFPAIRLGIVFLAALFMGTFFVKFLLCCLFIALYVCCTEPVANKVIEYWEKKQS